MALCLGLLALCGGAAGGRPTSAKELGLEPSREERQRRVFKDLLGRERWRRLETARFEIHLHDLAFTPELSDYPARHSAVGKILLRSFLKASQERVERHLRLEERRDALLGRSDKKRARVERPTVTVSPRFSFHSTAWLGAKLRLAGVDSRFWSHADLRLGSELDGGNASLKLAFQDHSRHSFLVYHADHPRRGEAIEFRIAFYF